CGRMSYDPFARGPFPVGVRTFTLRDRAREDRTLPVEVWYPAADAYAGADLAPASQDTYDVLPGFPPVTQEAVRDATPRPGMRPLVLFSHGYGGHRRQSTFFCTHVASHGYVVAACDHSGNTVFDVAQETLTARSGGAVPDFGEALRTSAAARPADVRALLDQLLDGLAGDLGRLVDQDRIGMSGHSFGGWTTLVVTAQERRIRAALPLAPAGGEVPMPVPRVLHETLDFAWRREVPTPFLGAERDSLLPLEGMYELLQRTPSRWKKMVVLKNTDHMHFCDRIEQVHEMFRLMPPPEFEEGARRVPPIDQLAPPDHAYRCVRG